MSGNVFHVTEAIIFADYTRLEENFLFHSRHSCVSWLKFTS